MPKKPATRIDAIVEPFEGILILGHTAGPLYCNKAIRKLCREVCRTEKCLLETQEAANSELFQVIQRIGVEYDWRSADKRSNGDGTGRNNSVICLTPDGAFSIFLHRILGGVTGLCNPLLQFSVLKGVSLSTLDIKIVDRKFGLTPSELRVLEYTISGLNQREISERLYVSNSTTKMHLHHVFEKLKIGRRSQILSRLVQDIV